MGLGEHRRLEVLKKVTSHLSDNLREKNERFKKKNVREMLIYNCGQLHLHNWRLKPLTMEAPFWSVYFIIILLLLLLLLLFGSEGTTKDLV